MNSYIRPVLDRREIRTDRRKAIGGVSARHSRLAAQRLARDFRNPILLTWAAEDHVFPLEHARRYAKNLGAELHKSTIPTRTCRRTNPTASPTSCVRGRRYDRAHGGSLTSIRRRTFSLYGTEAVRVTVACEARDHGPSR